MTPVMKITEALVVLFLVLFCYLFLDKTKFIVARMGNHLSIGERRY